MKKRLWLPVLVVMVLALGGLLPAHAAQTPTIITFSSSLESVTVDEAESGKLTTTLAWQTVGVTGDYRITLHTYQLNHWVELFSDLSVPLEASGSREVTIDPPGNFGPPTYLLSIVNAQAQVVDQRTLTIDYALEAASEPLIESFEAEVTSVDASVLAAKTAIVGVSWEVSNRLPTTNLVFEQVLASGEAVSVELPRGNLWVPSSGTGVVAPVLDGVEDTITLRLQVVDLASDDVYAEKTIELEVGHAGSITPVPTSSAVVTTTPLPGSTIVSFDATPDLVNPGAGVTLAWEVRGVGGVRIDQSVPGIEGVQTVVTAQSPKGSTTVYLPDNATYEVAYTLQTADGSDSRTVTVEVNCTGTFFFGQGGEGCPASEEKTIDAAFQPFEGGFMVWRGDTFEVYVFVYGTDDTGGEALYYLESSYGTLPAPAATEVAPLDRFVPVSGFGRVWANAPGVREKLGWGLEAESGYEATLQPVATGRTPRPPFALYLTLPDEEVIGSGYGRWQVIE